MLKEIQDMHFAVIDDMQAVRALLKDHLTELGISNVMLFNDGKNAIDQFKQTVISKHNMFDFIVSDWNMPKTKGIEVLKWVRNSPNYKDVPFLMLTAEAEVGLVKEAIENGVDSYIIKPWTLNSFREGIEAAYHKKQKEKEKKSA